MNFKPEGEAELPGVEAEQKRQTEADKVIDGKVEIVDGEAAGIDKGVEEQTGEGMRGEGQIGEAKEMAEEDRQLDEKLIAKLDKVEEEQVKRHGSALKPYKAKAVVKVKELGSSSDRAVGRTVGVDHHTVDELIKKYTRFDKIPQLLKSNGLAASQTSLLGFAELQSRLEAGEGKTMTMPALAVVAGIAAQRGKELLERPEPAKAYDFASMDLIKPDDVDQAINSHIINNSENLGSTPPPVV